MLLQWLLLVTGFTGYYWRENMTSSATPPTCPQVEPIKFFLLYCLVIQNGGRTRNFSIQVPLFSILLWNELFRKTKLKIVTRRQQKLNAKVLIVNAEKHQRHILMVKVSFRPKQNKQQVEELSLCIFFLTKRLRMWEANYGLTTSLKNLAEENLTFPREEIIF